MLLKPGWRFWRAKKDPDFHEQLDQMLREMKVLAPQIVALAKDVEYQRARADAAENRFTEGRYIAQKAIDAVWKLEARVQALESKPRQQERAAKKARKRNRGAR